VERIISNTNTRRRILQKSRGAATVSERRGLPSSRVGYWGGATERTIASFLQVYGMNYTWGVWWREKKKASGREALVILGGSGGDESVRHGVLGGRTCSSDQERGRHALQRTQRNDEIRTSSGDTKSTWGRGSEGKILSIMASHRSADEVERDSLGDDGGN